MRDQDKTKEQLINELVGMRQRVSALGRAEVDRSGRNNPCNKLVTAWNSP